MPRPTLFDHPKFHRLVHLLGLPEPHVLGHLEYLWRVGYSSGNPVIGDALDVEIAAKWTGDRGKFCEALVGVRLIDAVENGQFQIHDLHENAPAYVKSRERMERFRKRLRRSRRPQQKTQLLRNGDASPAPAPAPAPKKISRADALEGFSDFYARYPRHKKPGDAEKAWKTVKAAEKQEQIMAALNQQIVSGEWSNPKFIPYPASWLRAKCWEDEITPASRRGPQVLQHRDRVDWREECDRLHGGTCGHRAAHAVVMQRKAATA